MSVKKKFGLAGVFMAGVFLIAFSVTSMFANDPKAEKSIYSPMHSITQDEAEELILNYETHLKAGTLGEAPTSERFDPTVIEALSGLIGKDLHIYHAAHEDGSQCSVLRAGDYYFQKALRCPPVCGSEVSAR